MDELMQEIDVFNKERDWDQFHSASNLAKSISIEAGELLECFQWNNEDYDLDHVKEELADVMEIRRQAAPESSYVSLVLHAGEDKILKVMDDFVLTL